MTLRPLLLALVAGASLLVGAASADTFTYRNARYGTQASFPAEVFPERLPAPEEEDGLGWAAPDGGELYIYARPNAGGETPRSLVAARAADDDVTYRRSGDSWAVVSGYRDGKIFYERYLFRDRLIHSVTFRYPPSARRVYDPLVGPVTLTLRARPID